MRVEVLFTPAEVDELSMRSKNVVIIDVLRASSTICTALTNGAKEIIPTPDVESATKIASNLSPDSHLLGGERQGKRIDGFHLGNSPLEYSAEKVAGKTIVFTTTNGTGAIYKCRYASVAIIGSFLNLSAVVQVMRETGNEWTILCAGQQANFSIEDAACAGMILSKLNTSQLAETDDAGLTCMILYKNFKGNILRMMKKSSHGQYLISIGMKEDLKYCSEVDKLSVIPVIDGVSIRVKSNKTINNG
ncbi:MAG: 2-phosphosulfolactate phosphatase [Candidatus Kryptoniota bacterium]